MSARERLEARCIAPGRWGVEGWDVERRRTRLWRARRGDVDLFGPTLEDVCGQIIDWQDEHPA